MAGVRVSFQSIITTVAATIDFDILQLAAASEHGVTVRAFGVEAKGITATQAKLAFRLVEQTGVATGTTVVALQLNRFSEAVQTVARSTITVQATDALVRTPQYWLHGQDSREFRYPEGEGLHLSGAAADDNHLALNIQNTGAGSAEIILRGWIELEE